jgi:DNA-directed RNA polymerase subunit RPC12/RpoP
MLSDTEYFCRICEIPARGNNAHRKEAVCPHCGSGNIVKYEVAN